MSEKIEQEYEKDEETGGYWLAERLLPEKPSYLLKGNGFLPTHLVWINDVLAKVGVQLFGADWNHQEIYCRSVFAPTTITQKRLIENGKEVFDDESPFEYRRRGAYNQECLVMPITEDEWRAEYSGRARLNEAFNELRNRLYSGKIVGYLDLENQETIEPTKWAGEIWELAIYGEYICDSYGNEIDHKNHYPVFFKAEDLERSFTCSDTPELLHDSGVLSPYIRAAIYFSKKLNMSESSNLTLENVKAEIEANWLNDCGEMTSNKATNLARLIRWPSHEKGGNRKIKK